MARCHSHHDSGFLMLDALAAHSGLRRVSPGLKTAFSVGTLLLCVGAADAVVGASVAISMLLLICRYGGVPLGRILRLLRLPLVFLMVSCLVIWLDFAPEPIGIWRLSLGSTWLCVTRVTIADIVAMEPDVILLDEPTASLDPENETRLEQILDALTRAGIALVVSTHDVDFAARFAHRGLVFSRGKLMADGPMDSIFSREALLREAGLRKPWLWQAAEALRPGEENYPMTMEQFARWQKTIV